MSGRLKHKVEVFSRVESKTESGQRKYDFAGGKYVWCQITPFSQIGLYNSDGEFAPGGRNPIAYTQNNFKFVMRANALDVQSDMYFMYRNQRYDIRYAIPYFKDPDYQEVYCVLRMESDTRNGYQGSVWSGE